MLFLKGVNNLLAIICTLLCILIEIPFGIKFMQAHKNFNIIRETAILLIMLIIVLIFFVIYKLGLFVIR